MTDMALLDLTKLTTDLSSTWAGYLRDWDRTLRAGNYPETTRYNYLLAATQLARYLAEHSPDPGHSPRHRSREGRPTRRRRTGQRLGRPARDDVC
ncbi:hypothetical protein [Micromonospora ureilytica]|uniref:hypothetical protein n=1 Tax=Micromonospora ureilytica TaxID=709868 RepID=UPI00403990F6